MKESPVPTAERGPIAATGVVVEVSLPGWSFILLWVRARHRDTSLATASVPPRGAAATSLLRPRTRSLPFLSQVPVTR